MNYIQTFNSKNRSEANLIKFIDDTQIKCDSKEEARILKTDRFIKKKM